MVYPENIEEKIGVPKVQAMLSSYCLSEPGRARVKALHFEREYTRVKIALDRTAEMLELMMMEERFTPGNFFALSTALARLRTEGAALSEEELFELLVTMESAALMWRFFADAERQEGYPGLWKVAATIQLPEALFEAVQRVMDRHGKIKDTASEALLSIRREATSLRSKGHQLVYEVLREARRKGWARDDAEVSIRNGRVVVPVLASYKRSIKGFIHDESATGQTAYIEPLELFDTNNRLRELELEEANEILRILQRISVFLSPYADALEQAVEALAELDFIRAKAMYAGEMGAVVPRITDEPLIRWKQAIHPVLLVSHRAKGKSVVPLDLELNGQQRILVVSGPNAGGKSVLLKNVALNQYLLQCGLPITVGPMTEAGIFNDIFIDIGDEQSIDDDLSTYSSHLRNIAYFLKHADSKTLFLIDELGSGTEPELGAAIAAASLVALSRRRSYGVITTHYARLKVLSESNEGIFNGAMMFDIKELKPLYRYKEGKPGSSFAFEIAGQTGLPGEVLSEAEAMVGSERIHFDRQLQALENDKEALSRKLKQLDSADRLLSETIAKYRSLYEELNARKKELIYEARREAKAIIAGANKEIERAVSEIRQSGFDRDKVKAVRKRVADRKQEMEQAADAAPAPKRQQQAQDDERRKAYRFVPGPIGKGDYVLIEGYADYGVVENIKNKKAIVHINNLRLNVSSAKLQKIAAVKSAKKGSVTAVKYGGIMKDIHHRAAAFTPAVDLRGKRAEDVRAFLIKWLDEALLTGHKELEILHGTGHGVLRQVIRDYLRGREEVAEIKDAPVEFGGQGKTLVRLK